jgi:hypothetical protein
MTRRRKQRSLMPETETIPDGVADSPAAESPSMTESSPLPVAEAAPVDVASAPVVIAVPVDAAVSLFSTSNEVPKRDAVPSPTVPDGYMRDARGRLIPVALIKPQQLLEDALVREIHGEGAEASEALRAFREKSLSNADAFLELVAQDYGVTLGGDRGNLTLSTFDGTKTVSVSIGDQIDFGPELQIAKDLTDACIRRWSIGADVKLLALVDGAFDVDKKGKLNTGRILALRRYNIDDPDWKRAVAAIGDSVRVVYSKRYLRLYTKDGDRPKEQVPLDLASV